MANAAESACKPLTAAMLVRMLPMSRHVAERFVGPLQAAMTRFGINTPTRQAAFIAQVGHESGHLRRLVENLNYSAAGLAATWPGRFRGADGKPNALALSLHRQPEAIANVVYANRMGNGDTASGDGWRYRGRGLIQLTGRDNYRACAKAIGLPVEDFPEFLEEPEGACLSAAWFWSANQLNRLADADQFERLTRKINGGTHGLAERIALYKTARAVLV